jgi:tripartite-type tricarboxylate transporter receptor subunit TctC
MKRLARTTATTAFAALTGLAALMPGLAWAQNGYPTKPIRVIVPFAAGSTTDIIARAIADKMSQSMGQTLVIDNRGGASGTIGQQAVATAAPDGYTVMIHSSSHTVSPSTFAKLPFDTVGDFAGVTPISSLPNALVISPTKNIKTLPQLLAAARTCSTRAWTRCSCTSRSRPSATSISRTITRSRPSSGVTCVRPRRWRNASRT